jgi:hypothetical protein
VLVAAERLTNDKEALHLLPFGERPEALPPIRLASGQVFSRVTITPDDRFVIAASGAGESAEVFVFATDDGALVDRFVGGLVSGHPRNPNLPGLSPVSFDSSQVVYRTARGSLAMRDLDGQASCLVRSAERGNHRLAGFGADGIVYLESKQSPIDHQIYSYDPYAQSITLLSANDQHLAAVPARVTPDEPNAEPVPWVIGVQDGAYSAIQAGGEPVALGYESTLFLPRDDFDQWLITVPSDVSNELLLRRVGGTLDAATGRYAFEVETARRQKLGTLGDDDQVCLAVNAPGEVANRCGTGHEAPHEALSN